MITALLIGLYLVGHDLSKPRYELPAAGPSLESDAEFLAGPKWESDNTLWPSDSKELKPEDSNWYSVMILDHPKDSDVVIDIGKRGKSVISVYWDGNVDYDTNNVSQASRLFWEEVLKSFPEARRNLMWIELKAMIDEKEKSK